MLDLVDAAMSKESVEQVPVALTLRFLVGL
jgi:hypothetical protein